MKQIDELNKNRKKQLSLPENRIEMSTSELVQAYKKLSKKDKELFWEQVSDDNDIVAYTVCGYPLTKDEYISEIQKAIDSSDKGENLTPMQVRENLEKWRVSRSS